MALSVYDGRNVAVPHWHIAVGMAGPLTSRRPSAGLGGPETAFGGMPWTHPPPSCTTVRMRDNTPCHSVPVAVRRAKRRLGGRWPSIAEFRRGGRAATSEEGKKNAPAGRNGSRPPTRRTKWDGGAANGMREPVATPQKPLSFVLTCFHLVKASLSIAAEDAAIHLPPSTLKAVVSLPRRDWA